jgi:hypothetical protein
VRNVAGSASIAQGADRNGVLPSAQRRFSTPRATVIVVMPGLVPGIHVFLSVAAEDVDGRDEPGHDELDEETP